MAVGRVVTARVSRRPQNSIHVDSLARLIPLHIFGAPFFSVPSRPCGLSIQYRSQVQLRADSDGRRYYDGARCNIRIRMAANTVGITTVLAVTYAFGWRRTALMGLLMFAGVLLIPNDDCGNAFNERWIRLVGASPLMFIPNVLVILLAATAFLGIRPTTA